jgi:hypothetical protein
MANIVSCLMHNKALIKTLQLKYLGLIALFIPLFYVLRFWSSHLKIKHCYPSVFFF